MKRRMLFITIAIILSCAHITAQNISMSTVVALGILTDESSIPLNPFGGKTAQELTKQINNLNKNLFIIAYSVEGIVFCNEKITVCYNIQLVDGMVSRHAKTYFAGISETGIINDILQTNYSGF